MLTKSKTFSFYHRNLHAAFSLGYRYFSNPFKKTTWYVLVTLNVTLLHAFSLGIGDFPSPSPRPKGLCCIVIKVNNVTVVTGCISPGYRSFSNPSNKTTWYIQITTVNVIPLTVCIFPCVQVLIQSFQRDHQVYRCKSLKLISHFYLYAFFPGYRYLSKPSNETTRYVQITCHTVNSIHFPLCVGAYPIPLPIPTGLCWLLVLIFQELLVNVNLGRYFTICSCYSIAHRLVEPWHLIRFDTMLLLTWHYTCFGITHALALHMLWHYTCFL